MNSTYTVTVLLPFAIKCPIFDRYGFKKLFDFMK